MDSKLKNGAPFPVSGRQILGTAPLSGLAVLVLLAGIFVSGCVVHTHDRGHRHGGGVVVQPRAGVTVAPGPVTFVFTDRHRHMVRNYYHDHHPHGKKHKWKKKRGRGHGRGGPPPWARKGGNLPPGIAMQAIPYELATQLPPPPRGAQFIYYDDHVLLVDVNTHVVLDFIAIEVEF